MSQKENRSSRIFQSRQGAPFSHETYRKGLSALREQPRIALSSLEAKEGESVAEIAGRVKALRNQNSVEPAPERLVKAMAVEEPVTAHIRCQVFYCVHCHQVDISIC